MPRFAGTPPLYIAHSHRIETEGFRMSTVLMGNHMGTHLDAPSHFVPDGGTVDQIALDTCIGEALVIDLTGKQRGEEITRASLEAAVGDDLVAGDRLLIRTDWDQEVGREGYFSEFVPLARETAEWFVERQVRLVGVDIPTLHQTEFEPMHQVMLGAGIVIVESLANLRELTRRRVHYCGLPIKLMGADGAPVRAAAYDGLLTAL